MASRSDAEREDRPDRLTASDIIPPARVSDPGEVAREAARPP
jgi:hypothetical protein